MPDIFDEVEEDLRADQLRALLRRYAVLLVGAAVLVVAGAGGWEAWQWRQHQRALRTGEAYYAATKLADAHPGPQRQQAVPGLESVARKGLAGYRALARLREAALRAESGDVAGASALWLAVADDGAADRALRDVAGLQWAEHQLDTADPSAVAVRLAPLARPENPLHGLAQEAQALLALRQGQTEQARQTLGQLSHDESAPEGVRRRAGLLVAQLPAPPPAPGGSPPAPQAKAGGS